MKKLVLLVAAVLVMAGVTSNVMATDTEATVTATPAGALLIVPMTLTQGTGLHFGNINIKASLGGTVVLSTTAERTPSVNVALSGIAPAATNATYSVTGTINETYALTLPATITVTETVGSTATMTISALKVLFLGGSEISAVGAASTLSAAGTDSFIVGGTLTIAASQVAGIYAGTFPVTVDYN